MGSIFPALLVAIFAGYRRSRWLSARRIARSGLSAIE
jgi:general stress protein CsbA